MKPTLLYLCHRIPYPPNKGDKIRSFHLLRYLSQYYRVFLGAFIDDMDDWRHVEKLRSMCEESFLLDLEPKKSRVKSLTGFLSSQPLTLPYYYNRRMADWVAQTLIDYNINRTVVYSSAMAQYVTPYLDRLNQSVLDFVDIDSDKWRQYGEKKRWPMSWVYRREADRLFGYESEIAAKFCSCLFVSSAEASMFKSMLPAAQERIGFYNNGVDTNYFSKSPEFGNPYREEDRVLVFTGAMDYWPNIDAVTWFAEEVLPRLRVRFDSVHFYIVGSNPTERVKQLAVASDIHVTGRVEDIRPYLQYAIAAVAPMRIARGIQNKVLEAMSMEKTVIVSDQGFEGINATPNEEILLANTADDVITLISQILDGGYSDLGMAARRRVLKDFSWEDNLPIVRHSLEQSNIGVTSDYEQ